MLGHGPKMLSQRLKNHSASRLGRQIRMCQRSIAVEEADKDACPLVRRGYVHDWCNRGVVLEDHPVKPLITPERPFVLHPELDGRAHYRSLVQSGLKWRQIWGESYLLNQRLWNCDDNIARDEDSFTAFDYHSIFTPSDRVDGGVQKKLIADCVCHPLCKLVGAPVEQSVLCASSVGGSQNFQAAAGFKVIEEEQH